MKKSLTLKEFPIPDEVANVAKTLENKGFEAYLIGGCVRDVLIGKKPNDWDITTNATPEQIITSFPKTFYENDYGTVGVVNESTEDETLKTVEVTPYRLETKYSNSRHPDSVTYSKSLGDDLKRRDFTVNAIALKLGSGSNNKYKGQLVDLYNGQEDLAKKVIKTVGNPQDRFQEDALRILRAIRLVTELGFTINVDTKKAIKQNAETLKLIAKERIRDEFSRILMSDRPMEGIIMTENLGLLKYIVPILEKAVGVSQNKAHSYDVFEHTLRTLQHAADKKWPLEIRLASLFHDLGKPETRRKSPKTGDWTFYGHDVVGARITAKSLTELKYPNKVVEKVVKLVRWHMFFSDTDQITLSAVRRLVGKVGQENVWDLMNVRACDRIGTGRPKESPYRLRKYKSMIEEVMRDPVSVSMLKIDGNKIMELTKVKPGPSIGYILHLLLEDVLEDPKLNNSDYLEKKAEKLAKLPEIELKRLGEMAKAKKEMEEQKNLKNIRDKYWVK